MLVSELVENWGVSIARGITKLGAKLSPLRKKTITKKGKEPCLTSSC